MSHLVFLFLLPRFAKVRKNVLYWRGGYSVTPSETPNGRNGRVSKLLLAFGCPFVGCFHFVGGGGGPFCRARMTQIPSGVFTPSLWYDTEWILHFAGFAV